MRYTIHFHGDTAVRCIAEAEVEEGRVTSLNIDEDCVESTGYSHAQLRQFILRLLKPQTDRNRLRKRFIPGYVAHVESLERRCGPFSVTSA